MTAQPATLQREGGVTIAYHHTPGNGPGVIFCPGFKSDMTGTKAQAFEASCRADGQQYTRFDYQGHGQSSGEFVDGTIGDWLDDTLAVLDTVTDGPQVVVGSSMGAWIGLLAAQARPGKVAGFVGIAPAVDFTQRFWERIGDDIRRQLETDGVWMRPSEYDPEGYPMTLKLIEEGRRHLLMPGPITFDGKVHLLHGQQDEAVPWRRSLEIADALSSQDVTITLIKDGDHRLSRAQDIDRLCRAVSDVTRALGDA